MVKRWLTAAMVVSGLAAVAIPPALGQNQNPERCALIGPASERLECYDAIFRSNQFTTPDDPNAALEMGLWASGVEVSQIEGTELPFATLRSEQLIPAQPRGRAPARMAILCVNDETVVQFSFGGYPMGTPTSNSGTITLQYDRQPPRSQSLELSPDGLALGFFSDADARDFIARLLETQRLYVRATPVAQRSVTVSFLLDGIEAAIEPVREACGW